MTAKKFFGTDGIRGKVGFSPITPDFMLKLGWAAGKVFAQHKPGKILIGKDTRISGYMLESALEAGLSAAGENILLVGPIPTPGIAYLTRTFHAQAGIVISASHNPFDDNGVKFFSSEGKKLPDDIELAIEAQLDKEMTTMPSGKLGKAQRIDDAAGRYIEFCKASIASDIALHDLTIVLDCANGATYHIAPSVFRELGANIHELSTHPNGLNINHECGATHLHNLQKTVVEKKAHLGIAFDGDGDRVMMVDEQGSIVDGDELLFIIAKHAKETGLLNGGGIVGTLMTNYGMELALRELHIPFERANVGDRYVIEMLGEKGWKFGGESSGHIICLNKTTTGDGIIAALQVVAIMKMTGKSLAELKCAMKKFPQKMINVPTKQKIDLKSNEQIQQAKISAEKKLGNTGRVLLRASGTEPLIRVMVEAEDNTLAETCAQEIAEAVKASA